MILSERSPGTLLILNGEQLEGDRVRRLCSDSSFVVCADGAADFLQTLDITPNLIVGDLDSISPGARSAAEINGVEVIQISDQSTNDLEKALSVLVARGRIEKLTVLGTTGCRLDHTLTNLSVLKRFASNFADLSILDRTAEHFFLFGPDECTLDLANDTVISVSGFGSAFGVSTTGLRYVIHDDSLELGHSEGLSNVVISNPVTIEITEGCLLVSILD